jgi:hypothetical protein
MNAAAACSRSSALLNLRRGGRLFKSGATMDVPPLISSTPRRRIRLRCFIRDQFVRPVMTPIDRRVYGYATNSHDPTNALPPNMHERARSQHSRREMSKTGGFALAPQTRACERHLSNRRRTRRNPVRPRYHTPALLVNQYFKKPLLNLIRRGLGLSQ